jgi:hypothetical protein
VDNITEPGNKAAWWDSHFQAAMLSKAVTPTLLASDSAKTADDNSKLRNLI